jgi:probable HAF family extracellular repeat protein
MKIHVMMTFMVLLWASPVFAQKASLNTSSDPRTTDLGYQVFDLDTNNAASLGAAFRMSESGIAAGVAIPISGGDGMPALWTMEAGTQFLPLLPDDDAGLAKDVSETGIAVGESDDVVPVGHQLHIFPHATVWVEGEAIELESLVTGGADLELFQADRINEKGQILGWGRDPSIPTGRGFLFEEGILTDLGSLKADGSSEPFDMNELGHVVGRAQAPDNFDHAFLWKDGVMKDLHDPDVVLGRVSTARAINESGVIVGSADFVGDFLDYETATVWDHGVITNLGVLGGNQSYARDINDHGTIVGTTTIPSGFGVHAFIYQDGVMTDLNDLIPPDSGWILANAHDITNDGRIVGEGFNNGLRPFLLVPDCNGGFEVYGAGCAGSGGFIPGLYGEGCPEANGNISLVIVNGLGGGAGLLLFGSGKGIVQFKPGCDVQILPLLPLQLPLVLGGTGAGAGTYQLVTPLPPDMPPVMITMQALLIDGGGSFGYTVTNPLEMDVQ